MRHKAEASSGKLAAEQSCLTRSSLRFAAGLCFCLRVEFSQAAEEQNLGESGGKGCRRKKSWKKMHDTSLQLPLLCSLYMDILTYHLTCA